MEKFHIKIKASYYTFFIVGKLIFTNIKSWIIRSLNIFFIPELYMIMIFELFLIYDVFYSIYFLRIIIIKCLIFKIRTELRRKSNKIVYSSTKIKETMRRLMINS